MAKNIIFWTHRKGRVKNLLLWLIFLLPVLSSGSPWKSFAPTRTCPKVLKKLISRPSPLKEALYFEKKENISLNSLGDFAKGLFFSNLELFIKPGYLKKLQKADFFAEVVEVKKIADHSHYPYFKSELNVTVGDKNNTIRMEFRSNGKMAFLMSTWAEEQRLGKRVDFKGVYKSFENELKIVSQTDAILTELPNEITLSRVMSSTEAELWRSGNINKIISQTSVSGTSMITNPKTTFALNFYEFRGGTPYMFKIEKEKLEDLNDQGLLTINSYEDIKNEKNGMTAIAQTKFGFEVELVIHSKKGQKQIVKMMQKALSK